MRQKKYVVTRTTYVLLCASVVWPELRPVSGQTALNSGAKVWAYICGVVLANTPWCGAVGDGKRVGFVKWTDLRSSLAHNAGIPCTGGRQ